MHPLRDFYVFVKPIAWIYHFRNASWAGSFNTEPNKFYIYHFGLEKCSLMSIVLSFWNKVLGKMMKKWTRTVLACCKWSFACQIVTCQMIACYNNYFYKKLFKNDLASRSTKNETWVNDAVPFMSIKLSSEYEGTHYVTEGSLHGTEIMSY